MKKILLTLLVICLLIGMAYSQNADNKWGFGIFVGKTEFNSDAGNNFLKTDKPFYGFGSLALCHYLNPSFNLGLQGSYGDIGDNNYWRGNSIGFLGKKTDLNMQLIYKFDNGHLLKEKAVIAPFLSIGAGLAGFSGDRIKSGGTDLILPYGGGVKIKLTKIVAIQYQLLYNDLKSDNRDFRVAKDNDGFISHTLGLVFCFGSPKDSDNDGVADKLDKCPNTPAGVAVNPEGCPLDKDNDGIADYLDKCPDVKGIAKFDGCPDSDGDGIPDSEDKCPTVAGIAAFQGCPDTDGDGIPDSEDKCPNVAGIAAFQGCPDTDGDGIPDAEDRCPTEKGPKATMGCPDRDNDGIPDIDDKCPDVPGIAANKGCPEIKEETRKVLAQALKGVQFETAKDVIKPPSFPILDNVVKVMQTNPEYILEINGHTDNQGDAAKNLDLSQRRANSVKVYLVKKGIAENRLIPTGFGQTVPVGDNKTAQGRAINRRVEFHIVF